MIPKNIKDFNGKQITLLIKSIKKIDKVYVHGEGYFDSNKEVKYPYYLMREATRGAKNDFHVKSQYYSLYVKDGKIGLCVFGRKVFEKIGEYTKVRPDSVVNLCVNVNKVSSHIGPLDSYDDCVILQNTDFDQSKYPNVYNDLTEMNTYLNGFTPWTESKLIEEEMDKHDSLKDYVYNIRRKERNEKIDEILNG